MYGHHIWQNMDRPDEVVIQSCSWSAEQGKCFFPLSLFASENLVSRDRYGRVSSLISTIDPCVSYYIFFLGVSHTIVVIN